MCNETHLKKCKKIFKKNLKIHIKNLQCWIDLTKAMDRTKQEHVLSVLVVLEE